jgi:3-hydroxyisobutyrate dehydrogenase-like beta-hydroxyacid dehydrogenase
MRWADTPRDVAAVSDVIFSIVTDGAVVKKVALGDDGVLAGIKPGCVYIDMGTIAPDVTREVAAEFARRGFVMLDAPLIG